jgi:hypothetical protein
MVLISERMRFLASAVLILIFAPLLANVPWVTVQFKQGKCSNLQFAEGLSLCTSVTAKKNRTANHTLYCKGTSDTRPACGSR